MKLFFRTILLGLAVLCCSGCGKGENRHSESGTSIGQWNPSRGIWQCTDTAMGTVIDETLYAEDQEIARETGDRVMALLEELEEEYLSWRLETSQIYRINAAAGKEEGSPLSDEMAALLQECLELSRKSEGAFDISIGALTRVWNIDKWAAGGQTEGFRPPSQEELKEALKKCGSQRIRLEGQSGDGLPARLYLPEGMQLDLGAVGKGVALSQLQLLLETQSEVTGAVISLGGSILTWGSKPDGSSWKVGIVNPADTSSQVGILSLEGQWCVSTSGDYERYVEFDGVRYHHILDPATGAPAVSDVRGVTILTKEGMMGDGLSTACFLLGPHKGAELAAAYGAEVLFVMADGEIIMSEGMEKYFTKT